jgi:hypothetical protein
MKVVINRQHGGFSLSDAAFRAYLERKGIKYFTWAGQFGQTNYTTVTEAEYLAMQEEDLKLPVGQGRFDRINGCWLSDALIARDDADLVAVVEELGEAANGRFSDLKVVEVPVDASWHIAEYDGLEWVAENHRTWGVD